jgi:hypothetical protein
MDAWLSPNIKEIALAEVSFHKFCAGQKRAKASGFPFRNEDSITPISSPSERIDGQLYPFV